jgi:prepilin-type N-terminal cleavage/methylation domain-containing protein
MRRAFTLLEVIVALVIVGMMAIATLSAFGAELRTADSARSALEAQSLAQSRLAMLRTIPADDLLVLPDSSKRGRFSPPFDTYEWSSAITRIVSEPDLFDATVRVQWPTGSYVIKTLLYRPIPPRLP